MTRAKAIFDHLVTAAPRVIGSASAHLREYDRPVKDSFAKSGAAA